MKRKKNNDSDSDFNKFPREEHPATSTTLIEKLCAKDEETWERMKRLFSNLFLDWCREFDQLQRADRQNIYQEVFLTAFKRIDQFRREGKRQGSFRSWLKTITRRKAIDYLRKQKKAPVLLSDTRLDLYKDQLQVEPDLPDFDESVEETAEEIEREQAIMYHSALEAIRRDFSERDWTIFSTLILNEKTIKAAVLAEEYGLTVDNVRKIKSRILKRFRTEYGDLFDESKLKKPPSE